MPKQCTRVKMPCRPIGFQQACLGPGAVLVLNDPRRGFIRTLVFWGTPVIRILDGRLFFWFSFCFAFFASIILLEYTCIKYFVF